MAHEVLKWMAGIVAGILVGVTVFWLTQGVLMAERAEQDAATVSTTVATPPTVPPSTLDGATPVPTPKPASLPPMTPNTTTLPNPGPIILRTTATPDRVEPNATADIRVTALDGQYTPVENVSVRIECAAGSFASTNTTAVEGTTDDSGAFRTVWQAPEEPDIAVTMRIYAAKKEYAYGEDSVTVLVVG